MPGGAADADGRLQAGDQLLKVDGQSLIGITQEHAADYLVRTGPVVVLEVAKQGAIYHGLAMLLQQPSPIIQRGELFSVCVVLGMSVSVSVRECVKLIKNCVCVPLLINCRTTWLQVDN